MYFLKIVAPVEKLLKQYVLSYILCKITEFKGPWGQFFISAYFFRPKLGACFVKLFVFSLSFVAHLLCKNLDWIGGNESLIQKMNGGCSGSWCLFLVLGPQEGHADLKAISNIIFILIL